MSSESERRPGRGKLGDAAVRAVMNLPTIPCISGIAIPATLRDRPQFVTWRYETRDGKPNKVPVNVRNGSKAKSNEPSTWATYDEAASYAEENKLGIGFVFSRDDNLVGIDLDGAVDPETGEVETWAQDILDAHEGGYADRSPSGTGFHLIVNGKLPIEKTGRKFLLKHTYVKNGEETPCAIEIYHHSRFFTLGEPLAAAADRCVQLDLPTVERVIYEQSGKQPSWDTGNRTSANGRAPEALAFTMAEVNTARSGVDAKLEMLLEENTFVGLRFDRLRKSWNRNREDHPEWSDSHYDCSLAAIVLRLGWSDVEAAATIVLNREQAVGLAHPDKHGRIDYLVTTVRSAKERMETDAKSPGLAGYPLTDQGNVERLADLFGDEIRYVEEWRKFTVYSDGRWRGDPGGTVVSHEYGKRVARTLREEGERANNELMVKYGFASEKGGAPERLARLARGCVRLRTSASAFDARPYLLNFTNGTLDLESGKLREHRKEDFLTKMVPCAYVPDAPYDRWLAFMKGVQPEQELRDYVQRAIGLGLVGAVLEHKLFLLHGPGRNGKSTLMTATQRALGSGYAATMAPGLLLKQQGNRHETGLADLRGVRLSVCCDEPHLDAAWDPSVVKMLTGGDTIKARKCYQDHEQFDPTHTIFVAMNALPEAPDQSPAFWSRICIIPFEEVFACGTSGPKGDGFVSELLREQQGIVRWAVEGFRAYHEHGLDEPAAVTALREEYRQRSDPLFLWLCEKTEHSPGERLRARVLFQAFGRGGGMSEKAFSQRVAGYDGWVKKRDADGVFWLDRRMVEGE